MTLGQQSHPNGISAVQSHTQQCLQDCVFHNRLRCALFGLSDEPLCGTDFALPSGTASEVLFSLMARERPTAWRLLVFMFLP
ncbi:hypothetical protein TNCV_2197311 [Trichonephila clavipes]|nr:hypothetical protein TNCV_2197311 [Trichonephila clavipes]